MAIGSVMVRMMGAVPADRSVRTEDARAQVHVRYGSGWTMRDGTDDDSKEAGLYYHDHDARMRGEAMTPEEAQQFVNSLALVGCHPRSVSQETVLRALLAQSGHYVAHEIIELYQEFGVAAMDGHAIIVDREHVRPMPDPFVPFPPTLPPFHLRCHVPFRVALFWPEMHHYHRANGLLVKTIDFAAGLLEQQGHVPLAIVPARWMFDLEPAKK